MLMLGKTRIIAYSFFFTFGLLSVAKSPLALEAFAQSADPSFDCLTQSGPTEVVSGFFSKTKFEPSVVPNKKFDARNASFEIPGTISHSMISLDGSGDNSGMCWAGGYVTASLSWHDLNISWDQSKHGNDGDEGTMENTTSATSYENRMTWTGMHVYNVHDGIRTNNTYNNWTVQHVWFDYIRDDCIENDHIYSGTVYDSLFDGCYTGISVRPSSSGVGEGETITIDKVLLRMEPMPYPYKWDTKSDPVVKVPGYGDIPFGYGNVFKTDAGNEPDFMITNSVFLLEYNSKKAIFPPKAKVSVCSNNTIIWLGNPADAPTHLLNDFPGCFTIITDKTEGKNLWKSKVADWHTRHPQVCVQRKPANPGEYSWPRFPPVAVPDAEEIPLTVSITAPADGATVSGTVAVEASVSDSVGIVGVQFELDGVRLGSEDTSEPYSVFWDTVGVDDGSYTLTAVARDAAGNTSESSVVVTVNNGASILTFLAVEDASIKSDNPDVNYGNDIKLEVDKSPAIDFLIKFSVSGIETRTIVNAKVRLYCMNASSTGGEVYTTVDPWVEGDVTWSSAPMTISPIASLGKVFKGSWVEVDVTDYITDEDTYSFRISSTSRNEAGYYSRERIGLEPQLVLTLE